MASTQAHNAQADARFIARDLPLCRRAHAARKQMGRAAGRPLAMAWATNKHLYSRRREKGGRNRSACMFVIAMWK